MIRWTLIGVPLMLALAAGTAWAMTARGQYRWQWPSNLWMTSELVWSVTVWDGGIQVHRSPGFLPCGIGLADNRMGVGGFLYSRSFYPWDEKQTVIQSWRVLLWAPVLLLSAYPVAALLGSRARLRRRRRVRGLCVECGYDLTDNVSGVCPECGMKIEP